MDQGTTCTFIYTYLYENGLRGMWLVLNSDLRNRNFDSLKYNYFSSSLLERNRSHENGAQSAFEFAWSSSSWNWLALDGFWIKWYMSDRFQLSMRTSRIASIKVGLYRRGHYHVRCAWRFDFVWVTVIRATASSVKFSNLIELEKLDLFLWNILPFSTWNSV